MKSLSTLLAGILFGVGLAMSGMTNTAKVQGFLDLFGNWIPDLAFVMGGAVLVTVISFRFILRREQPLFDLKFFVPSNRVIDQKLLTGAALFGLGWGLYGYCPGPAVAALTYLNWQTALFVMAMIAGMALQRR